MSEEGNVTVQWLGIFLLALAKKLLRLPHIVCLCGSTRFYEEFQKANLAFTLKGYIVLSIGCDTKADGDIAEIKDMDATKAMLATLHKFKIVLADSVHILNKGGYIGPSTCIEISHAKKYCKLITYLHTEDNN